MGKILILTPEEELGASLSDAIERSGMRTIVQEARGGLLDILTVAPPDLIILDLAIEDGAGVKLCREIRDSSGGELLPILLIGTGQEGISSFGEALAEGGDYYFEKPVDDDKLISKIRTYVGVDRTEPTMVAPPPSAEVGGEEAEADSDLADRVEQFMDLGESFKDGLLAPPTSDGEAEPVAVSDEADDDDSDSSLADELFGQNGPSDTAEDMPAADPLDKIGASAGGLLPPGGSGEEEELETTAPAAVVFPAQLDKIDPDKPFLKEPVDESDDAPDADGDDNSLREMEDKLMEDGQDEGTPDAEELIKLETLLQKKEEAKRERKEQEAERKRVEEEEEEEEEDETERRRLEEEVAELKRIEEEEKEEAERKRKEEEEEAERQRLEEEVAELKRIEKEEREEAERLRLEEEAAELKRIEKEEKEEAERKRLAEEEAERKRIEEEEAEEAERKRLEEEEAERKRIEEEEAEEAERKRLAEEEAERKRIEEEEAEEAERKRLAEEEAERKRIEEEEAEEAERKRLEEEEAERKRIEEEEAEEAERKRLEEEEAERKRIEEEEAEEAERKRLEEEEAERKRIEEEEAEEAERKRLEEEEAERKRIEEEEAEEAERKRLEEEEAEHKRIEEEEAEEAERKRLEEEEAEHKRIEEEEAEEAERKRLEEEEAERKRIEEEEAEEAERKRLEEEEAERKRIEEEEAEEAERKRLEEEEAAEAERKRLEEEEAERLVAEEAQLKEAEEKRLRELEADDTHDDLASLDLDDKECIDSDALWRDEAPGDEEEVEAAELARMATNWMDESLQESTGSGPAAEDGPPVAQDGAEGEVAGTLHAGQNLVELLEKEAELARERAVASEDEPLEDLIGTIPDLPPRPSGDGSEHSPTAINSPLERVRRRQADFDDRLDTEDLPSLKQAQAESESPETDGPHTRAMSPEDVLATVQGMAPAGPDQSAQDLKATAMGMAPVDSDEAAEDIKATVMGMTPVDMRPTVEGLPPLDDELATPDDVTPVTSVPQAEDSGPRLVAIPPRTADISPPADESAVEESSFFSANAPPPFIAPEPLDADLSREPVAAALWRLHCQQVTGALTFRSAGDSKLVFFENGVPMGVRSSQTADRLEEMLYREGLIDREAYAEARVKGIEQPRALAAHMVERSLLRPQELFPLVRRHLEETLLGLFEWRQGDLTYAEEHAPDAEKIRLARPVGSLVAEGVRRKYLLPRMADHLGGPSSLLAPVPAEDRNNFVPLPGELGLSAPEREVLRLVDGMRPIEEIVFMSGQDASRVYRVLLVSEIVGLVAVAVRGLSSGGETLGDEQKRDLEIVRRRLEAKFEQINHGNYFEILGVSSQATRYEVEAAHKRLTREFHPLNFSHPELSDLSGKLDIVLRTIEEARDVLADELLCASYRAALSEES